MDVWETMLAGKPYEDACSSLNAIRIKTKRLFREYNATDDLETDKRNRLMTELFESVGNNVWIEPFFQCEFGKNISIGNDVLINYGCTILDNAKVVIGDRVLFGPNAGLYAANHAFNPQQRALGICQSKPISIGNDVWLGGNVTVLGGFTIGENSIIGAGSVVTKDIPSNVIAAGNPCKVIRQITDKDKWDLSHIQAGL